MTDVLVSIALSVVVAAVVMAVTALVARQQGRVAVVDVAWGAAFAGAALVCGAGAAVGEAGSGPRTWLLVGLVVLWGGRLAWHIGRRTAQHRGEDPRYERLLGGTLAEVGMARAVRKVFALQGVLVPVIALPVSVGIVREVRWWPVVVLGAVVWAVGLFFEAVGDAQLAAYRSLPRDRRPQVLDTGLWAWTRHPNYFGDACVWWGLWLAGGLASGWITGLATVVAPAAMTWFLSEATGARLLEQTMMRRPGYPEYAARTSRFVPRPPRHG
jgi:steroid 5-alpha reductase family enzyme